ncbi:MAG TPA: TIGR01777 family oxidoreductase [Gemmatimonadales bacterium]|nr:TIGR01777 family oxidoreductase [Gemmatimonadales bacterium]
MRSLALSGASGLLGSALTTDLTAAGWQVRPLVRREAGDGEVRWDPVTGTIDRAALAGVTAAIHLAGEPIAEGRWSAARKLRIRRSRTRGTRLLAEALAGLPTPPQVLLSASAIGIYGDRGDEVLDEDSLLASDFLAEVAKAWEAATAPAAGAGIRVVHMRFGILLSRDGGALPRMIRPFQLGVGGPIANGRQWMSWIALPDAVRAVLAALEDPRLQGPVNVVAPGAVRNADFARTLGEVLHRPALVPVPAVALRLLFGEMADATLLASQRVVPARLAARGFACEHPSLDGALRAVLDR